MAEEFNICEECVPTTEKKDWWIQIVSNPRWVRGKKGSHWIVNSKHGLLVNEAGRLSVYYFPIEEVDFTYLKKSDDHSYVEHKGEASYWDLVTENGVIKNAVWGYENPESESEKLRGYVTFKWNSIDHWYEEEEEIYLHPRDPYTRIDAIPSSRHIQVTLNGQIVADSNRPVILFETGLVPRYYIPKEDIKMEYFKPSDLKTQCPYKGWASYLSAEVDGKIYEDVIWSYQDPVPELPKIKGLYSFYNEKVEKLTVDGENWKVQPEERLPYDKIPTDYDTATK